MPEQRIRLSAFLINPSRLNRFRNVKINYFTNIPNIQEYSIAYSEIKPFETIKIFDSSITGPKLDEIYHLNLESVYESSSNQFFIVRDNITIEVPKVEEVLAEEEQETKEDIEEERRGEQQEVSLETEKAQAIDETEKKEEPGEEIPATEIKLEDEKPIEASYNLCFGCTN